MQFSRWEGLCHYGYKFFVLWLSGVDKTEDTILKKVLKFFKFHSYTCILAVNAVKTKKTLYFHAPIFEDAIHHHICIPMVLARKTCPKTGLNTPSFSRTT